MNESFEQPNSHFRFPDIESEAGEFERVASEFGYDSSVLMFLARDGQMVSLDNDLWSRLENTDSNDFELGGWEAVHDHSNPDGEHKRDWESLRSKIESGTVLDAPIIMKFGDRYHLVSGNTRLMVCKAKGITPTVLLFEVDLPK